MLKEKEYGLRSMYFVLCSLMREQDGIFVLVKSENVNEDNLFSIGSIEELNARLNNVKSNFDLYLFNVKSIDTLTSFENVLCKKIFVPKYIYDSLNFKNEKLAFCDEFEEINSFNELASNTTEIINENYVLKKYIDDKHSTLNIFQINKKLILFGILKNEKNYPVFTKFGSILFANNCQYTRKINVVMRYLNKNKEYVIENVIDLPLYRGVEEFSAYVYDKLPEIQYRNDLISRVAKPFSKFDITRLLLLSLSNNDFDSFVPIEASVSNVSISIKSNRTGENKQFKKILKKIYGLAYGTTITFGDGKELIVRNKGNIQFIDLINHQNVSSKDTNLDDIDYKIIEYAKKIKSFKRSDIDGRFYISNRNANYRLKKLNSLGLVTIEGNGKLVKYMYKKSI